MNFESNVYIYIFKYLKQVKNKHFCNHLVVVSIFFLYYLGVPFFKYQSVGVWGEPPVIYALRIKCVCCKV